MTGTKHNKSNVYTKADFKKDIAELKALIGGYDGDKSGGGHHDGEKIRWFKITSVNNKKLSKPHGRYRAYIIKSIKKSGNKRKLERINESPKKAAERAFKELSRKHKDGSLKFSIQETTHGSNKKEYKYVGKKIKLKNPIVRKIGDTKFECKYEYNIKRVD